MKKKLLFMLVVTALALVSCGLLSCTKEQPIQAQDTELQDFAKKIPIPAELDLVSSQKYRGLVYNECALDNIRFTAGYVDEYMKEVTNGACIYTIYKTVYSSASGFGDSSHVLYSGGGSITTVVKTYPNFPLASYSSKTVDISYSTADGAHSLVLSENGEHIVDHSGRVRVDYNTVNNSCK